MSSMKGFLVLLAVAVLAGVGGWGAGRMLNQPVEGAVEYPRFPQAEWVDLEGTLHRTEDWEGAPVLVNFWATWCAPCRKEMPMLSELQSEFGGDDFEVLTLATGRNSVGGIRKFFDETGITNLPRHQDPKGALAKQMGVFGLPITVILDRDGQEIARLRGDADWSSDSAKAIISSLIDQTQ